MAAEAAWARSYATTWLASTPPPLPSAATASATTDSARSTASVAAPSGEEAGSVAMGETLPGWSAATHHRDQGRQDDRGVPGVDPGERLQVRAHGARSHPGRCLGPRVDQFEAGVAGQRGEDGADVGVARVGHVHWRAVDPAGRGDGLLCHYPPVVSHRVGHPPTTT